MLGHLRKASNNKIVIIAKKYYVLTMLDTILKFLYIYITLFKSNNNSTLYLRKQRQKKGKWWVEKWSTMTNATKNS